MGDADNTQERLKSTLEGLMHGSHGSARGNNDAHSIANTEKNKRLYALLGGRSGRVRIAKDAETGEYIQAIDDGNSSPLLEIVYTFFRDPTSSPPAKLWATIMGTLAVLRVVAMALETVDGPQYYVGRKDQSAYKGLPDHDTYYILYLSFCIPFLVDALSRLLVLCVMLSDWEGETARHFRSEPLDQFLTACNIISVVPFVIGIFVHAHTYSYSAYILQREPDSKTGIPGISDAEMVLLYDSSQFLLVLLRLVNLLVSAHVLRLTMHLTVVRTILTALNRAGPHLVLPVLFFLVFNIVFGVAFYFLEPCYNMHSCPWSDLLSSSFYSIVTMATVGYGNQVPQNAHVRVVAVATMLFGALFISMPLALIGNQYSDAVAELEEERAAERVLWADRAALADAQSRLVSHQMPVEALGRLVPSAAGGEDDIADEEESNKALSPEQLEKKNAQKSMLVQYFTKTQVCATLLEEELLDIAARWQDNKDKDKGKDKGKHAPTSQRNGGPLTTRALLLQAETMSAMPALLAAVKSATVGIVRATATVSDNKVNKKGENNGNGKDKNRGRGGRRKALLVASKDKNNADDSREDKANKGSSDESKEAQNNGGAADSAAVAARLETLQDSMSERKRRHKSESMLSVQSNGESDQGFSDESSSNEDEDDDAKKGDAGEDGPELDVVMITSGGDNLIGTDYIKSMQAKLALSSSGRSRRASGRVGPDPKGSRSSKVSPAPARSRSNGKGGIERRQTQLTKMNRGSFKLALDNESKVASDTLREEKSALSFLRSFVSGTLGRRTTTIQMRVARGEPAFTKRLREVLANPRTLKSRVWMFLELPQSGKQAYYYRNVMITFIVLSIISFFLETVPYFNTYGADTKLCGKVLEAYCFGKNVYADPGCFVQSPFGPTVTPLRFIDNRYSPQNTLFHLKTSPTNTAFEYYNHPDNEANDTLHQPDTAQSRVRAMQIMLETCYTTHSRAYDSASMTFPPLPVDLSKNEMGYTYILANNTVINLRYPLNECHRFGFNFGTHLQKTETRDLIITPRNHSVGKTVETVKVSLSRYSCEADSDGNLVNEESKGFQALDSLMYNNSGRGVNTFTSREECHRISPICSRIECAGSKGAIDGRSYFAVLEVLCFYVFAGDFLLRMLVSDGFISFFWDSVNFLDGIALLPFLVVVFRQNAAYLYPGFIPAKDIDFSVVSSVPGPFFTTMLRATTILRLWRLTRQFTVTQVLLDTFWKCSRQVLGMEALFTLMLFFFAIIMFELEGGTPCFVPPSDQARIDDVDNAFNYCSLDSDLLSSYRPGDRLIIGKDGKLTFFETMFDCLWFCFVTATTTGYGDKWPITNGGMFVNLFLMLAGSMYLAMPLCVVASTYYTAHQKYLQSKKKSLQIAKLTENVFPTFEANTFTSAAQLRLQQLYEALKAELFALNSLTNHLKRDYQSYLRFGVDREAERKKLMKGADYDDEEEDEEEEEEEVELPAKPPLSQMLHESVVRLQTALSKGEKELHNLAMLDCRRLAYLDKLEELRLKDIAQNNAIEPRQGRFRSFDG